MGLAASNRYEKEKTRLYTHAEIEKIQGKRGLQQSKRDFEYYELRVSIEDEGRNVTICGTVHREGERDCVDSHIL